MYAADLFSLKGKVAWVTGASHGIGYAACVMSVPGTRGNRLRKKRVLPR